MTTMSAGAQKHTAQMAMAYQQSPRATFSGKYCAPDDARCVHGIKMNTRRQRRENTRRRMQHRTCRPVLSHGRGSHDTAVPLRPARSSMMSTRMPDEAPTTRSSGALGSPNLDDWMARTSSVETDLGGGGGRRPEMTRVGAGPPLFPRERRAWGAALQGY